jgi:glycosyltransferase involved in cell wall biosynthesis
LISIIVAVHNQLAMNQLFWQHLRANTQGEWELVVIDNGSTDRSGDFFS